MLGIEVEVEKDTGMQAIKIIGEEGIIVEIEVGEDQEIEVRTGGKEKAEV